ncbi:hypothetical protein BDV98DRAFT_590358 [Pterulicium gracile]|uniref:4a-hydroxytetrahydrobiopterin dehydratase n=1 Tax=Pterulicium gracile TaxID=1884261 RepID=A0A5C3QUR1_9AGAR|nr:hypothetical protein BDV98DRAFT_590358 [Pterula gracilis]
MNVPSYRAYSSAEDKRNVVSFEAPPPVKGWPTPWLTQDEFNHYMLPLYEHNWRTTIETQKQIQAEGTQSTHALGTFLEKTFAFDDSRSCFAALQSIHELCEKEKHHCEWTGGGRLDGKNAVTIPVCTHTAMRPEWPEDGSGSQIAPARGRKVPGITLRDVRFAILLDQTLACQVSKDPPTHTPAMRRDQYTWDEFQHRCRAGLGFEKARA